MKDEIVSFLRYTGYPKADVFHYISLISIGVAVICVFKMIWYLNEKDEANARLFSFNPFIPIEYARITKRENGKTGIWLKILLISLFLGIASETVLSVM